MGRMGGFRATGQTNLEVLIFKSVPLGGFPATDRCTCSAALQQRTLRESVGPDNVRHTACDPFSTSAHITHAGSCCANGTFSVSERARVCKCVCVTCWRVGFVRIFVPAPL